jgi:hypothetical protein
MGKEKTADSKIHRTPFSVYRAFAEPTFKNAATTIDKPLSNAASQQERFDRMIMDKIIRIYPSLINHSVHKLFCRKHSCSAG